MWTNHERKSAFARAIGEKREYVLPARFDDTLLTGLRPTPSYIDLRNEPPQPLRGRFFRRLRSLTMCEHLNEVRILHSSSFRLPSCTSVKTNKSRLSFYLMFGVDSFAGQASFKAYEPLLSQALCV